MSPQVSALALILIAAFSSQSFAQQAPTGEHYAGRPSDTGYGGTFVNATGTFAATIPFDLPTARGGLPIPLQITYGARGVVGAAGLGWDLPLSYIEHDRTFAHRRPAYDVYKPPSPRERTFLSLLGKGGELVKNGNEWVLRRGTLEVTVRQSGDVFLAYDGAGRTYMFTRPALISTAGLWLLKSISTAGGAKVQLTYQINIWPLEGGTLNPNIPGGTGLEINLIRIAYNSSPVTGCAKNEVALAYDHGWGSTSPMSLSILGDTSLVRFHTLTQVDVESRATCTASLEHLRRYELQYIQVPDSGLPRLQAVRMFGRKGPLDPEETPPLPIASYEYGNPGTSSESQVIDLPPDDNDAGKNIAGTDLDPSVSAPGAGERNAMWHDFIDVTGDGRPDLIYRKNNKLWVALNRPAEGGKTTIGYPFINGQGLVPLQDSVFQNGPISAHTTTSRRLWYGTANRNTVDLWRQAIDVNGDGRIDIIDAGEEPDHWVIYLNTPGPGGGIKWVRRTFSVHNLRLELAGFHHTLDGLFVPLSRRTTGVSVDVKVCVKSNGTTWVAGYDGNIVTDIGPNLPDPPYTSFTYHCDHGNPTNSPDPPPPPPHCIADGMCAPPTGTEPEKTFVEWELTDLNGDGYPDFVFNSAPADFALTGMPQSSTPGESGHAKVVTAHNLFQLPSGNEVRTAFNVVGVRFDINEWSPFSRSVSLFAPNPEYGVGMWEGAAHPNLDHSTVQREVAGLADVNGDGLVDRVVVNVAYLGIYTSIVAGVHAFSSVVLKIPDIHGADGSIYQGLLSEQVSTQKERCAAHDTFTSELTVGFRDLNGDGIPDYYAYGQIAFGTGAGFATPIFTTDLQLSHQTESCHGDWSYTDGGLFDVDGDGIPEMVRLVDNNGQRAYSISRVFTPMDRLTGRDNGYSAKTRISYVSAKAFTDNPVPFPEIVVSSVSTTGALNLGGTLAGSRYAYGNAELVFDSAQDRFVFPGYRRYIEMRLTGATEGRNVGAATISDTWPLMPFNIGLTKEERWARLQTAGRLRDIYTLRGSENPDPWSLLDVYQSDPRVIGISHYDWGAKLFESPNDPNANLRDCVELVDPYDFSLSFAAAIGVNGLNPCRAHGFAFSKVTASWYGGAPPPSDDNVQTRRRTLQVDDFGRSVVTAYDNDVFRGDDDLCVENAFATPVGSVPRVLNALARRRVYLCGKSLTFANESFTYDGLSSGSVSVGHMTSHTIDRRATDDGTLLTSIRVFDATYNSIGNLATLQTHRDGATRTTTLAYDQFGLVPTAIKAEATSVPAMNVTVDYDPITLQALLSTDLHQVKRGTDFDRFGRPVRSTLTLPGGVLGVLTTTSYLGFDTPDPQGRRISSRQFSDPVAPENVATAAGRTGTTFLDELGRRRSTQLALGSDYASEVLVAGSRTYDGAGRIAFEADSYPMSQDVATVYGTSYYFKNTGDLDCIIRGRGKQPRSTLTDPAIERFPTCFQRSFGNNRAVIEVRDAASLQLGSPQAGVVKRIVTSAIGRVIERATWQGGNRLEFATFGYDQLGQQTSITRYLDPATAIISVPWSWRVDSFGQVLQLNEPETATRYSTYSDWGEPVETRWLDGAIDRRIVRKYDALGRLTASEELNDGVTDPETVNTFSYDVPAYMSPLVTPIFTLGRLARASSPSGDVGFSYDALGHINAQAFTDPQGGVYIQRTDYHSDGRLSSLEFNLPDQNYKKEVVKYVFDSAGYLRTMNYSDASGSQALYNAELIDPFGRVRKARYGDNTVFRADYADNGRRMIKEADVESALGSRRLMFDRFDPLGRELSRRELRDGAATDTKTNVSYDALGRLSFAAQSAGPATISDWAFRYDALGNILALSDMLGTADASLTYRDVDRDRICRIDYGDNVSGVNCNVVHDVGGRVISEPTRTGSRQFDYFASGNIRAITDGTTQAHFAYGPLGGVQLLNVQGGAVDQRREHRYGELIDLHEAVSGGAVASSITRHIPGPGGILASRRGTGDDWVFEFGELRGSRFFTNQAGAFIQTVDYQPFGEAKSSGAATSAPDYTSYQWNGGDALAAFGISQLGARLYDPVIGRFLSRDPLLIPRTSAISNPYSFAMNDPLNAADPSGLDCYGPECQGLFDSGVVSSAGLPPSVSGGYSATPQQQAPSIETEPVCTAEPVCAETAGVSRLGEGENGSETSEENSALTTIEQAANMEALIWVPTEHLAHVSLHKAAHVATEGLIETSEVERASFSDIAPAAKWIAHGAHAVELGVTGYEFVHAPSGETALGFGMAITKFGLALNPEMWFWFIAASVPWDQVLPDCIGLQTRCQLMLEKILPERVDQIDKRVDELIRLRNVEMSQEVCVQELVCRPQLESWMSPQALDWYHTNEPFVFGTELPPAYDDVGYFVPYPIRTQ